MDINVITVEKISEIQNDLEVYDIRLMVFILYDVPQIALERLILLQRLAGTDLNLLDDWAKKAQSRASWRHELLEALAIAQLYSVMKKIGFNVESVKQHFRPNINAKYYINPMKRLLYRICENMTNDNFLKLKNTLLSYNIDVREHMSCELVLLDLMCSKFIIINDVDNGVSRCKIENLAKILDNIPDMDHYATEMREIQRHMNCQSNSDQTPKQPSNSTKEHNLSDIAELCKQIGDKKMIIPPKLKTDTSKIQKWAYEIINKDRLGICYIINQEKFYPSKKSIEMQCGKLEDRKGSHCDKIKLEKTMEALNFKVIIDDNLTYNDIYTNLRHIVKNKVLNEDSVFILCILSHGIEGCIYSADSIPIKVQDLQTLLDGDDACKLTGKPKVIVVQACQVSWQPEGGSLGNLVADAPASNTMKKCDFIVLWATVPEYSAYRDEQKGSVFVQILCMKIVELAHEEHLEDIFKKVNNSVVALCTKLKYEQVCMSTGTLRKNLYLFKLTD